MNKSPSEELGFVDYVSSTLPVTPGTVPSVESAEAQPAFPPAGNWTQISFSAGRTGLLDRSTERGEVWADVLDSLQKQNSPAYVEIDPVNSQISRLLIPMVVRVGAIKAIDQGVEVELIVSHAIHTLRASHPKYKELLERLQTARTSGQQVAITEEPASHEIIQVNVLTGPRGSPAPAATETPSLGALEAEALAAVSPAVAQQMFDLMNRQVCCPSGPTASNGAPRWNGRTPTQPPIGLR